MQREEMITSIAGRNVSKGREVDVVMEGAMREKRVLT
jgi:hypothetical protein